MRTLREWLVRASAFVRPARPDADLEEELRSHASFAADAGRADRGAAHAMDALRDQRGLPWLDDLARDARYGARMLWRDRALSLVIVAILAAGIGAATAIYSLVDACLLRSDMPTYDRWVALRAHLADGSTTLTFFSEPELADARRATDVFDAVGAVSGTDFTLTDGDFPERVLGTYVTADVMPMLAVAPLLGRTFRSDEDRPGAPAVTVISYSFWQQHLAGDPHVLGRRLRLNAVDHTIIGVMPPHYDLWGGRLWVPFQLDPNATDRRARRFWITALMRRGVTEAQADARLALIAREQAAAFAVTQPEYAGMVLRVWNVREAVVAGVRPAMIVLLAAVALLLVTACANVANLLLARAAARRREMVVRAALGAGRGRIVRQMLVESLLLSTTAGAAGIVIAMASLPLIVALLPAEYLTADAELVRVNMPIGLLAAAVSIATGVLFGLAPALRTSKNVGVLRDRSSAGDRHTRTAQYVLSSVQIALTLLVAVAAMLTIDGYRAAERVALGFNPDGVVSCYVALPPSTYAAADRIASFYRTALAAIAEQPGISGAAAISDRPLGYRAVDMSAFAVRVPGHATRDGVAPPTAVFRLVSPGYFRLMQNRILDGRELSDADGESAALVAVVNEAFVRHVLHGAAAVGQSVVLGTRFGSRNVAGIGTQPTTLTIVGVVADSRQTRVIDADVRPELFLPIAQHPLEARNMALVVRTSLDDAAAARAIRGAVARADAEQPIFAFDRMSDVVMRAFGARRLTLVLLIVFAVVSISLAAVGLYGVISFGVQQRAHEIGIRLAVGATAASVVRMIVASGVRLAMAGIAAGAAAGAIAERMASRQVSPFVDIDPMRLLVAAGALLAVTVLAAWIPARRAARIDPLAALREPA